MRALLVIALIATLVTSPQTSRADDTEIRFGVTLSLAGGSAPFSEACRNAITMAADDVNSSGGISGKKLSVLIEDFGDLDLKRAALAAAKLVSQDKVAVMFTNWSEDTEVVSPIAERHGLLTMTLGAGGPQATRYTPSLFRATTGDDTLAQQSVIDQRTGGSTTACIITANTNYYVDMNHALAQAWEGNHGQVVYREEIGYNEVDLRSHVTRMRSRKCSTVFAWTSPSSLASLLRELKSQRVAAQVVLPWFGDSPEVVKEARDSLGAVSLYRYVLTDESFKTRYEERFKSSLMRPAANCYDGIRFMTAAITKVGTNREKLREEILTGSHYQGVTGPFEILPSRERIGEKFERVILATG